MAGKKAYLVGQADSKSGTTIAPFAFRFAAGKWHTMKTVKRGKQSEFRSVSASSKAVVAAGDWSLRGQCATNPTPTNPLLEVLHGKSFRTSSTPRLRRGTRTARFSGSAPYAPTC
jgi:hypothetical protein